jgi:hypothetical protein
MLNREFGSRVEMLDIRIVIDPKTRAWRWVLQRAGTYGLRWLDGPRVVPSCRPTRMKRPTHGRGTLNGCSIDV